MLYFIFYKEYLTLLHYCAFWRVNVCEYEADGCLKNSCKPSAQCHLCVHNVRSETLPHKKGFALWNLYESDYVSVSMRVSVGGSACA